MPHTQKITEALFGARLDPFNQQTRRHVTLVAFLAWVGLGADGLSSSCYGPEEAFLALGAHTHLALYMAIATALTVFIIAVAYNQVIELFPSGAGTRFLELLELGDRKRRDVAIDHDHGESLPSRSAASKKI